LTGSVDWSVLPVTGEDSLVDGWWTSARLPRRATVRELVSREEGVVPLGF
jgi:hypothetical protein